MNWFCACLLGNVAYRSRQRIEWDAKAEKITNAADARNYLSREYRKPWRLHVSPVWFPTRA